MRPTASCNAVLIALALVSPLSVVARPPFLPSSREKSPQGTVSPADRSNPFTDLWKLGDAAADSAYQKQLYRDSAAICLVSYLVAAAAEDQSEMFKSAWLMAFGYHFQGAADAALTAYRLALDLVIPGLPVSLENDQSDPQVAQLDSDHLAAKTLLNVGVLCTNARKMDSAERYFRRVINLAKMEAPRNPAEAWFIQHMLARAQSGLADLYTERFLYDKSIPLYEESKAIFESEVSYSQLRERAPEKLLPTRESLGAQIDLGHCLGSLGAAYSDEPKPNLVEARRDLERSLQLRKELKNNVYIADSQILLSKLEVAERKYNQAYTLAASAAELTAPGSEGDNPDIYWQALLAEGQSLSKLGRLKEAAAALQTAINTVENIRDPDLGSDEKSSFFNSVTWFFRQKVSPYVAMAEVLIHEEKPLDALLYAELAKARTLLLGRPVGVTGRGDSLGSTTINSDQLSNALSRDIPDQKTAVLEYVQGIDTSYVFLVIKDASGGPLVQVKAITPESSATDSGDHPSLQPIPDLDSAIDQFRNRIEKSYAAYPRSLGSALYAELIKPFQAELADKSHIIFVPSGKLWELPFQALLAPKGDRTGYLVESYAISYAPSLLFLNQLMTRSNRSPQIRNFLLLGTLVPSIQDTGSFPLDSIKTALCADPQPLPAKVFLGEQATRERFLEEAPDSKLILFATHAVVGGSDPTSSYFLLTSHSRANDGEHLTAADIMSRQLNASLVVLVACQTELGRFVEGEGEVGLGWAFLHAGCASTIVSQWKIDRDASLDLTTRFCQTLAQKLRTHSSDIDLADLLRLTQLSLLSDDHYNHPAYWAGLALVGDPQWRWQSRD
jgi:CHAT domain-containing protein